MIPMIPSNPCCPCNTHTHTPSIVGWANIWTSVHGVRPVMEGHTLPARGSWRKEDVEEWMGWTVLLSEHLWDFRPQNN